MDKHNVLILDDNLDLLDLYQRMFGDEFNILVASNLKTAHDLAKTNNISCALIDLKLNGDSTDGLCVTEFVKASWCVIVSGYISSEAISRANASGITSVIQKPIDFKLLLETIRRIVHRVIVEKEIAENLKQWKEDFRKKIDALFDLGNSISVESGKRR